MPSNIQHNLGRFTLTVFGIRMLLMIVMGMAGIYRGLIEDATLLVERIGADLWVVNVIPAVHLPRFPGFRKPLSIECWQCPACNRQEFVFHTIQREHNGKPYGCRYWGSVGRWTRANGCRW